MAAVMLGGLLVGRTELGLVWAVLEREQRASLVAKMGSVVRGRLAVREAGRAVPMSH